MINRYLTGAMAAYLAFAGSANAGDDSLPYNPKYTPKKISKVLKEDARLSREINSNIAMALENARKYHEAEKARRDSIDNKNEQERDRMEDEIGSLRAELDGYMDGSQPSKPFTKPMKIKNCYFSDRAGEDSSKYSFFSIETCDGNVLTVYSKPFESLDDAGKKYVEDLFSKIWKAEENISLSNEYPNKELVIFPGGGPDDTFLVEPDWYVNIDPSVSEKAITVKHGTRIIDNIDIDMLKGIKIYPKSDAK